MGGVTGHYATAVTLTGNAGDCAVGEGKRAASSDGGDAQPRHAVDRGSRDRGIATAGDAIAVLTADSADQRVGHLQSAIGVNRTRDLKAVNAQYPAINHVDLCLVAGDALRDICTADVGDLARLHQERTAAHPDCFGQSVAGKARHGTAQENHIRVDAFDARRAVDPIVSALRRGEGDGEVLQSQISTGDPQASGLEIAVVRRPAYRSEDDTTGPSAPASPSITRSSETSSAPCSSSSSAAETVIEADDVGAGACVGCLDRLAQGEQAVVGDHVLCRRHDQRSLADDMHADHCLVLVPLTVVDRVAEADRFGELRSGVSTITPSSATAAPPAAGPTRRSTGQARRGRCHWRARRCGPACPELWRRDRLRRSHRPRSRRRRWCPLVSPSSSGRSVLKATIGKPSAGAVSTSPRENEVLNELALRPESGSPFSSRLTRQISPPSRSKTNRSKSRLRHRGPGRSRCSRMLRTGHRY